MWLILRFLLYFFNKKRKSARACLPRNARVLSAMFNARVLLYSFRYREQQFGELIFVWSWDQKRKQWREGLQQWSEVKSWLLVLFLRDDCGNFVILFPGLFCRTSGKEILYFVVDGYVAIHGDPSLTRVNVKCFFRFASVNKRTPGLGCDRAEKWGWKHFCCLILVIFPKEAPSITILRSSNSLRETFFAANRVMASAPALSY